MNQQRKKIGKKRSPKGNRIAYVRFDNSNEIFTFDSHSANQILHQNPPSLCHANHDEMVDTTPKDPPLPTFPSNQPPLLFPQSIPQEDLWISSEIEEYEMLSNADELSFFENPNEISL